MVDRHQYSLGLAARRSPHAVRAGRVGGVSARTPSRILAPRPFGTILVMAAAENRSVNELLSAMRNGDAAAVEQLMRLMGGGDEGWENRRHFFFAAARAMHDILVEQARRNAALKRGGDRKRIDATDLVVAIEAPVENMIALDEALQRLRTEDERKYTIVQLRFFGGLSMQETAAAMDTPLRSLEREWTFIRARLHRDLSSAGGTESG